MSGSRHGRLFDEAVQSPKPQTNRGALDGVRPTRVKSEPQRGSDISNRIDRALRIPLNGGIYLQTSGCSALRSKGTAAIRKNFIRGMAGRMLPLILFLKLPKETAARRLPAGGLATVIDRIVLSGPSAAKSAMELPTAWWQHAVADDVIV